MIESISISDIASYNGDSEKLTDLSKINFIFGSNSSGKTTISRVIADESAHPTCNVKWKHNVKLQTLVYNQNFIEKNFNQSTGIKGIFTLGEDNIEIEKSIEKENLEIQFENGKILSLQKALVVENGLNGKKGELNLLDEELKNKCWDQKLKYEDRFTDAFTGYRTDKIKFKNKILEERVSNKESVKSLEFLEKKAEIIFDQDIIHEDNIDDLKAGIVTRHEIDPILKKPLIGKEDVDIARMIKKLDNSDWVKRGRSYYEQNNGICPFCQQSTTDTFTQSLNEYFDETFNEEIDKIESLSINYNADATRLLENIDTIIESSSKFLDLKILNMKRDLLDSIIKRNIKKIEDKKNEPSQIIELESIGDVFSDIETLINSANNQIAEHNLIFNNLKIEKAELISQIWKYILEEELKDYLEVYEKNLAKVQDSIQTIENEMKTAKEEIIQIESRIRGLECQTTSLNPTKDDINSLLSSFGFRNFSLEIAEDGPYYKLIRQDGTDATETLSEGEKSFLTFLYFFHLLKGSQSESGIADDRVVVFDDPVSSLDSDILFIVSSLIKGLFEEVRYNTGHVKQIFVMTHNVYFHKEVTFNPDRSRGETMNEETFWIVRRYDSGSKLTKHAINPIKNSYDLLWDEVRNPERSSLTIQNTIRRILENYFTILGGMPLKNLPDEFEGQDKKICGSMISWIHDGSHNAHDDLYITIEDETVDKYLEIFKEIFDKTGHSSHYNMMMGI